VDAHLLVLRSFSFNAAEIFSVTSSAGPVTSSPAAAASCRSVFASMRGDHTDPSSNPAEPGHLGLVLEAPDSLTSVDVLMNPVFHIGDIRFYDVAGHPTLRLDRWLRDGSPVHIPLSLRWRSAPSLAIRAFAGDPRLRWRSAACRRAAVLVGHPRTPDATA
jgi:hypothetical protein